MTGFRAIMLLMSLRCLAFPIENSPSACKLGNVKNGQLVTVTGVAVRQAHDLVFDIKDCQDTVVLTYAGDPDTAVTADHLHRDKSLKQFQKYTSATYKSRGPNICMECMRYEDVHATLTGQLEIATIPPGTTKDSYGFLHDSSGKVVGTSGFGHPTRPFKYRLVILSASDVTAQKRSRPH